VDRVLRSFTGAHIRRVVDRSNAIVPEHAHDWPVLSIFVMGSYSSRTEIGHASIAGPSAVLYRAGAAHRNWIGSTGFEQIEIEFDPVWLGGQSLPATPVTRWTGGGAAYATRELARTCACGADEALVRSAVSRFLEVARHQVPRPRPAWVDWVDQRLRNDPDLKLKELARALGRHPSWLGMAYRRATGEAMGGAAARLRLEQAAKLLRESDETLALVAAAAGFCDQSHMNRTFRRMVGRSPSDVRTDRLFMRAG
jgi:AraC family transcriptional regulator